MLDVGCGPGRHALALADAGHEVVGLEPSADGVFAARRRGVDARLGDVAAPPADLGTFDTFLLLGGGLELLGTTEDPKTVLDALASLARPGAQVIGNFEGEPAASHSSAVPRCGGLPRSRYRPRVRHRGDLTDWSEWGGISFFLDGTHLDAAVRGTAWGAPEVTYPTWADVPGSADSRSGSVLRGAGGNLVRLRLCR